MANWRHTIRLNEVIGEMSEKHDLTIQEDDCPMEVKEAMAAEVEKAPPIAEFGPRLRKCKSIAAVNRTLAQVFDMADRRLVWCGAPT